MKVKILTHNGEKEVTVYATETPGLVVHKHLDVGWQVTCMDVGLGLCGSKGLPTRKAAKAYARALGKIAKWSFAFVPKDCNDQAKIKRAFLHSNPRCNYEKVGKQVKELYQEFYKKSVNGVL